MLKRLNPVGIALLYAALAALWIVVSGSLLNNTVSDPLLQTRLELGKGLAFVAVTSVLLYLLLNGWRESFGGAANERRDEPRPPATLRLALLFIAMALVVPLIGVAIVKVHIPQTEQDTFSSLESIAQLKAGQIVNWLGERNGDSMMLYADEGFALQVDKLLRRKQDKTLLKPVLDWLNTLRAVNGYDSVLLLDDSGETLATLGEQSGLPHVLREMLPSVLSGKQVRRSDIFRDESGHMHLDWVVPLLVSDARGQRVAGIVVLRAGLQRFLFPLIQTWPAASTSGETLLVREEGGSVVFLNELRFNKDAPLNLRRPLTDIDLPAATALHDSHPGTVQGNDYRGIPVLAAYSPVAGTDWRVVAKIDRNEVMEPVWSMVYWIGLVGFAVIMVIMGALLMIWRQQWHVQSMALQAEKARADIWMHQFFDLPFIGMAITSPTTKRWLRFNDHLCTMLGYPREELAEKDWTELTYPDDLSANIAEFESVMCGKAEGYLIDKRFIRKDGSVMFATIDARCVRKPDGAVDYFVTTIQDITASKQAEQALRESESSYRSLFDNMLSGVAHCRMIFQDGTPVDYEYIKVNRGFENVSGLSGVEGRRVSEVIPSYCRDNPESLEAFGRVALTGEPARWEHYLAALDRWFAFAIYSPASGEFVVVSDNISERKKAEAALVEREEIYRSIVTQATDGIVLVNADTLRFAEFNDAACRSLGYSREEFAGLGVPDIQGEMNAEVMALRTRNVRGKGAGIFEALHRHKDGSLRDVRVSTGLIRLRDQDYFAGIWTDITERKRVENALRQSQHDLQEAEAVGHIGSYVFDIGSDAWRSSEVLDKIFGINANFLRTANGWLSIVHPSQRDEMATYLRDIMAEHKDFDREYRIVRVSDGAESWVYGRGKVEYGADGKPVRMIGIIQDITVRKQMEQENYLLLMLGRGIAEAENFVAALAVSIRMICDSAGWVFGEVWTPSSDGTHLDLGAPYFCKVEDMRGFRSASEKFTFAPGTGLPGRVWVSGKPVWIPDVTLDANFPRALFARQFGLRAAVGIPIMTENACVAVLAFYMCEAHPEDERMVAIISAVAAQLGVAFQRKLAEERIQRLANFDLLTGLPNRALFAERFNYALSLAQRNNGQLALMYIDLDHFKNVNETLGQRVGDALLVEVAKRLKVAVRDGDTVSRQGGDEFILLLPGADANEATHLAEHFLASISQHYLIEQYELVITPSMGIAMYPGDGADFEALSKCADTAMYRAKADGRNNYRFFTPGMQMRSARSLLLENALRRALARGELSLHYQPQVSLQDGHVVGVEALLRWQHAELGMVSPAEFIPVAESSGQILAIGEWVMRTAVAQMRSWIDKGMVPIVVAVNLSAIQFRHASLPELVTRILDEEKLPPQYLELELTEGVTMDDPVAAIAVMDDLHERGIRMSIDDFGTGYSSLSYLKKFKVYKLKIDQSFVRDISDDPEDKAIVSAIINMASSLGMQTIAEGVETAGQLAFLRLQGCNEVQGYYFSKPLQAEQFEAFVQGRSDISSR